MSQIFDALQRSEAERSGVDLTELPEANELLRRVELHAASKWATAGGLERGGAFEDPKQKGQIGLETLQQEANVLDVSDEDAFANTDERMGPLGKFPPLQVSPSPQSRLVCLTDKESAAAEAFRLLGVRLGQLRRTRTLKKVLITSTIPQEGKSMVAANLACTLAQKARQRVVLVEGDVRRPSISQMFGLSSNPGLCEWLQGERSLMTSVYHLEGADLWIVPAGKSPSNPLEMLQSGRLAVLMDQLAAWFDWTIIDSPPVLPLADTSVWTRLADGILLVTRQGITEKKQLQRGLEALDAQKMIGALLNCSKRTDHSDYYYRTPKAQ